jgi:copper homeostasis protein (lipoprotein)
MIKNVFCRKGVALLLLSVFFLYPSCNGPGKVTENKPGNLPVGDNSMTSLNWNGTYEGVIPCADCNGIETSLKLNKDYTYLLRTRYVGKDTAPRSHTGSIKWNSEGNKITLDGIESGPSMYLVGENRLFQLDLNGNRITGDLSGQHILVKKPDVNTKPDVSLTGTYWKLIEIRGQKVQPATGSKSEAHIILHPGENRVTGSSGCNSITGTFEINEKLGLVFSGMASTRMACPEMETENEFISMIQRIDSYSIRGDTLSLHRARMAPLARFVASNSNN